MPVAPEFSVVQKQVSDLLKDRILVGHSVQNDLKVHSHTYIVFTFAHGVTLCKVLCIMYTDVFYVYIVCVCIPVCECCLDTYPT